MSPPPRQCQCRVSPISWSCWRTYFLLNWPRLHKTERSPHLSHWICRGRGERLPVERQKLAAGKRQHLKPPPLNKQNNHVRMTSVYKNNGHVFNSFDRAALSSTSGESVSAFIYQLWTSFISLNHELLWFLNQRLPEFVPSSEHEHNSEYLHSSLKHQMHKPGFFFLSPKQVWLSEIFFPLRN